MDDEALLQILLWLAYPLTIYFGLQVFEPRGVAVLLAGLLLLRRRRDTARFLAGLTRIDLAALVAMLCLASIIVVTNNESILRLYPAAMNACMLLVFGLSLKFPPSMVERFARLREPDLPASGVRYTRRVTQVWCVFFVANGTLALWTAWFASRAIWELYNGLIAYVLMGILFAGEWMLRPMLRRRSAE